MLLYFKKQAIVLAVVGLVLSILYATVMAIDKYYFKMDFLRFNGHDFLIGSSLDRIILLMVAITIYFVFIIKPMKSIAIITLIISIASVNIFLFIASIMVLKEISKDNLLANKNNLNVEEIDDELLDDI